MGSLASALQSIVRTPLTPHSLRTFPALHQIFLQPNRCFSASLHQKKRVLGAIAHINSGKTTTSEAMLYTAGALRRMGNVDVGDTTLDYLPDERERGITINAAAVSFNWKDHQIFLVDSPGHLDFTFEVERALKVMDSVIVLLDAVSGVQPQTETVWRQADSNALPRVVFVNKMDRDGADFEKSVSSISQCFVSTPCVIQYPIFHQRSKKFDGVFDLLTLFDYVPGQNGLIFKNPSGDDVVASLTDLSPEQQVSIQKAANTLVETVADVNDQVMSLWLDESPIPREVMTSAVRQACIHGKLVPVLFGSSLRGIGVEPLLDAVVNYLPSPAERSPVKARSKHGDEVVIPMSEKSPFLAYAFKVSHDKHRGRLVHFRAFCGDLKHFRGPFLNTTKGKKETPTKILRVLADKYEEIQIISPGDIFAAVGLKQTETGDTLVLMRDPPSSQVILSGVKAPPPVFSVALEVEGAVQERELEGLLARIVQEDCSMEQTVDNETGETLLSGMGELHLEVAVGRLSRSLGFPVRMSRPRVSYRETITESVESVEVYDCTIGSSRFQATLRVKIEPHAPKSSHCANLIDISDEFFSLAEREAIADGVNAALGRGPLLGSSVTNLKVSVFSATDAAADTGARNNFTALRGCARKAIQSVIRNATPRVLEPVMRVHLVVPTNSAGDIISEISHPTKRRGTIDVVDVMPGESGSAKSQLSAIEAMVPLEGMIGWATKMRSITKGRGDFSTRLVSYRLVDELTQKRLISFANGS